jgi:hypothetical protein
VGFLLYAVDIVCLWSFRNDKRIIAHLLSAHFYHASHLTCPNVAKSAMSSQKLEIQNEKLQYEFLITANDALKMRLL